jgi:hypothetical protein
MAEAPVVRCLILSHKRAGRVATHKRVANCELAVAESQAEEYANAYPELPLIVHPELDGLPAKRQWLLEHVEGDQCQLDDDMLGFYRVYRRPRSWKRAVLGPERAWELVQRTAETARELGAFLFGWGKHAHPMSAHLLRPFKLGGYSPGGAMGILAGSKLWFPAETTLPLDDYWVCLLNAYHHRFAFYDGRFAAGFAGTYSSAGGMAEYRAPDGDGVEPEVAATQYLRRFFGDAVRDSRYGARNITRRERNPGRRQIVTPYRV